jgi:Leucine-rich repeat (LRR) protein
MKHFTKHPKFNFAFLALCMLYVVNVHAQYEDKSYLKNADSLQAYISKFIPDSKFGPVVTPLNLAEALKNPTHYKCARFTNANLTAFPEQLFLFPYLEEIDISHNSITSLPSKLNTFKTLRELHVNNNQITSFGTEITSCPMLEVIQIQKNPLENITKEIGQMSTLREITIGEVSSKCAIPAELWSLVNLKKIKITNANLVEIPTAIANMKQLDELCLANNSISEIPEGLYTLQNITYINLGYNKINAISSSVNKLQNLDYLGIYYNPITTLPDEIMSLKKLSFLSCWRTQIPAGKIEQVRAKLQTTQVHDTETGIH